jgi:uncharacterized protein (DUF983 family)
MTRVPPPWSPRSLTILLQTVASIGVATTFAMAANSSLWFCFGVQLPGILFACVRQAAMLVNYYKKEAVM